MKYKRYCKPLFVLFAFIQFGASLAQEERAIDNKGTIVTIRNNTVVVANMAPVNPLEGDIWIDDTNTTETITNVWDGSTWQVIKSSNTATMILNTRQQRNLPNATNTFFNLPLATGDLQTIDNNFYSVNNADNSITILETGNYLLSGEISVRNMPAGDTKYILALFINNVRRGYLSRGFASLPNQDFWGTTGTIMYRLQANDVITIRYVLNAGQTITSDFLNIGITKI